MWVTITIKDSAHPPGSKPDSVFTEKQPEPVHAHVPWASGHNRPPLGKEAPTLTDGVCKGPPSRALGTRGREVIRSALSRLHSKSPRKEVACERVPSTAR